MGSVHVLYWQTSGLVNLFADKGFSFFLSRQGGQFIYKQTRGSVHLLAKNGLVNLFADKGFSSFIWRQLVQLFNSIQLLGDKGWSLFISS